MTATAEKKKKVMTFMLRKDAGSHFEPNPDFDRDEPESEDNLRDIEYSPGDKVKSTRPLDKIFVNKFVRKEGDASGEQTPGGDVFEGDPEDDPDRDRPVRSLEAAHTRQADRFAEEDELEGKEELKKLAKGQNVKSKKKDEEEDDEDESSDASDFGEDVTDDFEGASDAGLKVLKDDEGTYRVFEEDDLETPMDGSNKGFTEKKKVKAFIKKQSSGDE